MFQADLHPNQIAQNALRDSARRDAQFAFYLETMVSRRARRPISLPRPPFTRGR